MRLPSCSRPTILEDSTLPRPGMQCTTTFNIRTSRSPYATQSLSSTASSAEALNDDVPHDRDGFTFELSLPPTCTTSTAFLSSLAGSSSSEHCDSPHTEDPMHVFSATMSDRVPGQSTYQREMLKKGHGHPLWNPEPDVFAPPAYRQTGVSVGDVGILCPSGTFRYLFNVFLDADNPCNPSELPEGFAPLKPFPGSRIAFDCHESGFVTSPYMRLKSSLRSGIRNLEFTFFNDSEDAVLILPEGCHGERFQSIGTLRSYAAQHGESWYRYANGPRGLNVENGQLQIVTQCDKTTSWAILTHFKEGNPSSNHRDGLSVPLSWVGQDIDQMQCGVKFIPQQASPFRNQCVFLRSSGVYLSDVEWGRVRSPSLFPDIGGLFRSMLGMFDTATVGNGQGSGSTRLVPSQHETVVRTPSNVILNMLLKKHPEAKTAIVHDNDWCAVLRQGDSKFPSDEELCRRILETFEIIIDEKGCLYLARKTCSPQ